MMQYFHGTCGTNETWLQESIDLQFMSKIYRMHHAQLLVVAPTCLFRSSRSACPMAGSLATFCRFLACFCLLSISCMIQEIRHHTFNISYDELTIELLFQTKTGSVCLAPPHSVLAVLRGTFATQYLRQFLLAEVHVDFVLFIQSFDQIYEGQSPLWSTSTYKHDRLQNTKMISSLLCHEQM